MKIGPGLVGSALLTGLVVTLLAGLFVLALPPVYVAKATVRVEPHQVLLLQSGQLVTEVVSSTDSTILDALAGWDDQLLGRGSNRVDLLADSLSIEAATQEHWFNIHVTAYRADAAARLADNLAEAFLRRARTGELSSDRKQALLADVSTVESSIDSLLSAEPRLLDAVTYRQTLETDRRNLVQRIDASNRLIRQYEDEKQAALQRNLGGLTDAAVVRAMSQLDRIVQRQAELQVRYGSGHQKVKTVMAEKAAADSLLDAALTEFLGRLDMKLAQEKDLIDQRRSDIDRLDAILTEYLASRAELETLKMKRETSLAVYRGESDPSGEPLFAKARVERHNTNEWGRTFLAMVFVVSSLATGLVLARFEGTPV